MLWKRYSIFDYIIYQDSLLYLFNILTILHLQKLGVQANYFWGGNEQTD